MADKTAQTIYIDADPGTVMDVIAEHSRREVADSLPPQDPFLHPGEILVAHVADTAPGPRVVATERHRHV